MRRFTRPTIPLSAPVIWCESGALHPESQTLIYHQVGWTGPPRGVLRGEVV